MALNLWLKNTLLPIASKEAETTNNSFESIFSLLTAKQISEASVKVFFIFIFIFIYLFALRFIVSPQETR